MITVYEYVSNKANTIILALFSPYTVVDDVRWVIKADGHGQIQYI